MNTIVILGRTTDTIEIKQTASGKPVANFSIAVKRPFTKDVTDFHNVVAWDKQAELLGKYVKKGNQVCIRGYLTNRSFEDKHGNKRVSTEIIAEEVSFVGGAGENATEAKNTAPVQAYIPTAYGGNNSAQFEEIPNGEDLPF